MKTFHMLLSTGATVVEAVKLMQDQLNKEYADKATQLQQIFLLPELKPTAVVSNDGKNQMAVQFNLIAVITEEPLWDDLQRNYKEVFDKLVIDRAEIIPALLELINLYKLKS